MRGRSIRRRAGTCVRPPARRRLVIAVLAVPALLVPSSPAAASGTDLISELADSGRGQYLAGQSVSIRTYVLNNHGSRAGASRAALYLSRDRRRSAGDARLAERPTRSLSPYAKAGWRLRWEVPSSTRPGRYYLISCADVRRRVRESSERNNCDSAPLDVAYLLRARFAGFATTRTLTQCPNEPPRETTTRADFERAYAFYVTAGGKALEAEDLRLRDEPGPDVSRQTTTTNKTEPGYPPINSTDTGQTSANLELTYLDRGSRPSRVATATPVFPLLRTSNRPPSAFPYTVQLGTSSRRVNGTSTESTSNPGECPATTTDEWDATATLTATR